MYSFSVHNPVHRSDKQCQIKMFYLLTLSCVYARVNLFPLSAVKAYRDVG